MFQINGNQVGNSILQPVRSGYDAYYDHTVTCSDPQNRHVIRSYNNKFPTFTIHPYQDVNIWEAVHGRPVPPSLPFGTFLVKNPNTISEWKQRAYGILFAVSGVWFWNQYKVITATANRKAFRIATTLKNKFRLSFAHLIVGGVTWINYVAYRKEQSPAGVYHQLTNGERIKLSILLGIATGLFEAKHNEPWYGQYPRLSIIYHRVKAYFIVYGLLYTVGIHIFLSRTLTAISTSNESPIYNVAPWWWEKDSLPYHNFDGTQLYRTLNYRRQLEIPKVEEIEVVDEYSPFSKKMRQGH